MTTLGGGVGDSCGYFLGGHFEFLQFYGLFFKINSSNLYSL